MGCKGAALARSVFLAAPGTPMNLSVHDCGHTSDGIAAMKRLIAFIPGTLLATFAWSQTPPPDDAKEPRDLGHTAVMHVYWYAPKTTEITHVESYLFKDEAACRSSIDKALMIAMPHAAEGDLVSAQCVGMHPDAGQLKKAPPDASTVL